MSPTEQDNFKKTFLDPTHWLGDDDVNNITLGIAKRHNPDRYYIEPTFQISNGNHINILPTAHSTVAGEESSFLIALSSYINQEFFQSQINNLGNRTSRLLIPYLKKEHFTSIKIDINNNQINVSVFDPFGTNRNDIKEEIKNDVNTSLASLGLGLPINFISSKTKKLQSDGSACGVITAAVIEEFTKNNSFIESEQSVIDNLPLFPRGALELRTRYFTSALELIQNNTNLPDQGEKSIERPQKDLSPEQKVHLVPHKNEKNVHFTDELENKIQTPILSPTGKNSDSNSDNSGGGNSDNQSNVTLDLNKKEIHEPTITPTHSVPTDTDNTTSAAKLITNNNKTSDSRVQDDKTSSTIKQRENKKRKWLEDFEQLTPKEKQEQSLDFRQELQERVAEKTQEIRLKQAKLDAGKPIDTSNTDKINKSIEQTTKQRDTLRARKEAVGYQKTALRVTIGTIGIALSIASIGTGVLFAAALYIMNRPLNEASKEHNLARQNSDVELDKLQKTLKSTTQENARKSWQKQMEIYKMEHEAKSTAIVVN